MSYLLANSRHCLDWVALLMSLLGTKWSRTMAMCSLSNTPSKPAFSNSLMATGVVMSLPSTMSSLALMSWPALTSARPACAARIFCVWVIPMMVLSFLSFRRLALSVIASQCHLSLWERLLAPPKGELTPEAAERARMLPLIYSRYLLLMALTSACTPATMMSVSVPAPHVTVPSPHSRPT